ncbi:hypothetical protein AX16_004816 [Volvariella volvacea WC 439]|nr:hypothetical protein AX16_004816 [Volvariella volvacea WC 439]
MDDPHKTVLLSSLCRNEHDSAGPVSIHVLYPDILKTIFLIVADLVGCIKATFHKFLTFVLIGDPGFNSSWVSEWQQRAGSVPFRVTLSADKLGPHTGHISVEPIHQAFPDFTRIESLDVRGDLEFVHNIFSPYANTPNSNIRHLTVLPYVLFVFRFTPVQIFHNEMPHLETLYLGNYDLVDWNSISNFQALKHLRVSPPASISLDIFAALPHLEELEISIPSYFRRSTTSPTAESPPTYRKASFQLLRALKLYLPSPILVARLLEHLTFPSCTSFDLSVTYGHSAGGSAGDLLSTLSRLITTGLALSQLPIHCLLATPSEIVAKAWEKCDCLSLADGHSCASVESFFHADQQMSFSLRFFGPQRNERPPKSLLSRLIIRPLLDSFNFDHLRFLSWEHIDTEFTHATLELEGDFFDRAPELRGIEVKSISSGFFDGLLASVDDVHVENEQEGTYEFNGDDDRSLSLGSAPCHSLCKLMLILPNSIEDHKVKGLFHGLIVRLQRRNEVLGLQLESLIITGGPQYQMVKLSDSLLSKLRELVKDKISATEHLT